MILAGILILSSCFSFLCPYLLHNFARWPFIMFLLSVTGTVQPLTTKSWSTGGLGHVLCKSTEGKTTWALPGLSFQTFLIFESASNTCAFMNNVGTTHNTCLFIVDNWISCLMNTATVMLKKGKRCHVCRHPHSHHHSQPCRYPQRQPCIPVCPSLPTATHSWTDSVVQYGRRENTGKQQKTLPAKSPSKLLCFPEMVMLLHSLGRFLNCCFSQYLYSGCGYLIVGRDRLCWWQNVGCPQTAGERHDTELQVKKHSLYFLLFLMAKTIWCYI